MRILTQQAVCHVALSIHDDTQMYRMKRNPPTQGRGCGTKPNDLVTSCHGGWLTDRPFSLTAASKGRQQRQKSGSPGLKQDMSAHISSARADFSEDVRPVHKMSTHGPVTAPPSQGTTKRLCCDKPEINWRYYVSEGSALFYIRGQGVSYVLTQSYIISHILFQLPPYPTWPTPPNGSSPRTRTLYNNL